MGARQMTAWSSRAKNPIEMRRTPFASGGTMTSSMSPGGAATPSIRGMEKAHTSAATAAPAQEEAPHGAASRGAPAAPVGERPRQVGGDRGLAAPALARRHRQHPGPG